MNRFFHAVTVVMILLAPACRSKKEHKPVVVPVSKDTSEAAKLESAQEKLDKYAFNFDYLTMNGSMKLQSGDDSKKASMVIRMKRDSVIWMSISVGIEAFRVLVDKDSIRVMDRIHQKYMVYPISYTEQLYNMKLTLRDIQNILVGNLLFNDRDYVNLDTGMPPTRIGWIDDFNECITSFSTSLYRPEFTTVKNKKTDQRTELAYSTFDQLNGMNLARKMAVNAYYGSTASQVELEFNKVNSDMISGFPFFVPSSYDRKN